MENTVETADLLSPEILAAIPAQENPSEVGSVYSADDIAKAREQEKAKLYPQMEKMKEELSSLKKAREEQAAKEAEREQRNAEELVRKEAQKKEDPALIMEFVASCVDVIYDKSEVYKSSEYSNKEVVEFLEQLSQLALKKIMNFFEYMPSLEKTITYSCCGKEKEVTLKGAQSFFQ